jgi:hypothetical protein
MGIDAERRAERRLVKLAGVQRQLKEGSLTIRQMTTNERKLFPPLAPKGPPK